MATLFGSSMSFLTDTFRRMLSTKPSRYERFTDWSVGLSCFAYMLPAVTIWFIALNVRNCILYEFSFYIVVSTNSFIADYIFMGQISIWHAIDRWTATACFIGAIIKTLFISLTILDFILIIILGYIALYLLNGSRKATCKSIFKKYHIGWHIIGGFMLSYLVYLEHKTFYNLEHPFIRLKNYLLC
eukprot:414540_1